MNRATRLLLPVAASAAAIAVPGASPGSAATTCSITQITKSTGDGNWANLEPVVSGDGKVIAFASSRNYVDDNADSTAEIFRYNISIDTFKQLSDTDAAGIFGNSDAAIDDDGSRIAWTSTDVNSNNLDGNREIVLWTGGDGPFSSTNWVTSTAAGFRNGDPTMDGDGSDLAFVRSHDDVANIFRWNDTDGVVAVTDVDTDDVYSPDLSRSGGTIVFGASADIGGLNAAGAARVFIHRVSTGQTVKARTSTSADIYPGGASDDGIRIPLTSKGNPSGGNADGSDEVFLHQRGVETIDQVTNGGDSTFGIGGLAMDGAGNRVVFESDRDEVSGGNTDGSFEIFIRDFSAGGARLVQVTDSAEGSGELSVSRDGRVIVFSSGGDHTGENPDGNREIYMADCFAPPAPAACGGALATVVMSRGEAPTGRNDVIVGTRRGDVVKAGSGDDVVCGLGRKDTLNGGRGNDRLFGGRGEDVCLGGRGTDTARKCETVKQVP